MIEQLTVSTDSQVLTLTLTDGQQKLLSAALLRRSANDAWSRKLRFNGKTVPLPDNLRISAVVPMGNSGVRIEFSDGHNKAIYPFAYLMKLAQGYMPEQGVACSVPSSSPL